MSETKATSPAASSSRRNPPTVPPRRGKIKAQIFRDVAAAAAASKAGGLLPTSVRGEGGGATPQPVANNADNS